MCVHAIKNQSYFLIVFFISLWIDFGSLLALILNPDRPKFNPKCSFKPYHFQKRACSRKALKTNEF